MKPSYLEKHLKLYKINLKTEKNILQHRNCISSPTSFFVPTVVQECGIAVIETVIFVALMRATEKKLVPPTQ